MKNKNFLKNSYVLFYKQGLASKINKARVAQARLSKHFS